MENFSPPKKIDCLIWSLMVLEDVYQEAGAGKEWQEIKRAMFSNMELAAEKGRKGLSGVDLAQALSEKGWKGVYFNPDALCPANKPAELVLKKTGYGKLRGWRYEEWKEHAHSYAIARKNKMYYGIRVDDFLVNYRPTTELRNNNYDRVFLESVTKKENEKINQLKKLPFAFIVAQGGEHLALLSYGKVYDADRYKGSCQKDLISVVDFETEWKWLSGIIMFPPAI